MSDCWGVPCDKLAAVGTVLAAAATFGATLVALFAVLWPLWKQRRDRDRLARNLRARVLVHVMHLINTFNRRAQPNSGPLGTDPLKGDDLVEVRDLEQLFGQAPLLTDHENNLLIRLLANLHAASLMVVHPETNRNILALLRELHAELEREFLQGRGKLSEPPWREEAGG